MHSRQLARFTRFGYPHSFVVLDSIHTGPTRQLFITAGRTFNGRDSAVVTTDSLGRVTRLQTGFRGPRHSIIDDELQMSETRLWDIVPSTPRGTPRVDLTWTDTIAHVAVDGPDSLTLRGNRVSRIVGDSTIGTRHLWRVRDSATVAIDERFLDDGAPTAAKTTRTARGILRGTHLYDPARHLDLWRADTMRLAGEAVLHPQGGRVFRTPTRFESNRRFTLLDSATYAARMADRRRARERAGDGMVFLPTRGWEERLGKGDRTVLDSLVGVWRRISDPNDASDFFADIQHWSGGDRTEKTLDSIRVAAGDSAFLYETLMENAYGRGKSIDSADARAMIPFMDPAMVWSIGSSHSYLAANIVQALTTWPPSAGVTQPACTPSGCTVLGAQHTRATEPTIRDVGLVALFSVDPTRWADTVLALNGPAHPMLASAAMLARGVGATWPAASKAPLPPRDSDWRAWLEWMNGVAPAFATDSLIRNDGKSIINRVRFEESHVVAIHFYTKLTGRDILGELRRGYDRATTDSTRYVFAVMLDGLDALQMSEADIADALTSAVPARVALGKLMLNGQFDQRSTRMSDSLAAPLYDRVIAAIVDGIPLWRSRDLLETPTAASLPDTHVDPQRRFVGSDGIPASVIRQWTSRANLIGDTAWKRRDLKAAGVLYTIAPIRVWGRFARVTVNLSERVGRARDEAPEAFAAGQTYDLMLVNGEWVLLDESGWIT